MGMIKPVHPVIHFRLKQEIIGQIDEWRSNVAVFLFIINCWEIPLYLLVVLLSIKRLRINACGRVFPDETLALKTGYKTNVGTVGYIFHGICPLNTHIKPP